MQQELPESRLSQPRSEPFLILPNLIIESRDGDVDVLDDEECLSVFGRGVLESDVEGNAFRSELDVEETRVFEGKEAGLWGWRGSATAFDFENVDIMHTFLENQ